MTTEAEKSDDARRDPSAWLLLHCFAGPAIGTIIVILLPLVTAGPIMVFDTSLQWHLTEIGTIPILLLLALAVGWFFGFLPALLHAVVMLLLRRFIHSRKAWLALTPVVGWLAVFCPLLVLAGAETPGRLIDSAWMSLLGSAAATGCMLIAWRRNMYPV